MNIWLVNHYANAPTAPGDARHFSHARELIRRGNKVRVIACSYHHLTHEHIPMAAKRRWEHQVLDGVPFTWIRASPYEQHAAARVRNMFQFSLSTAKLDWAADLTAPDLILGSSPHPFAALAAERIAARFGVPFVLEIRDLWPYVLTEVGGYSKHHPFVIMVDRTMRHLYSRAASIIMFSRDSRDLLIASGAAAEKILWIPHGVDLMMNPQPRPAPADGVFTVTYIGAHNRWNDLDPILDAAKLLQSSSQIKIVFRFVGDGACRPALIRRVETEGIANAEFLGARPKNEIPALLHSSDAFILNNRVDEVSKGWMSFNKVYEYLAAGRPVVFGCCTPINPVHESGAGLLVDAGNATQIAKAVEALASQCPERLEQLGHQGRLHIEQHYDVRYLVDRFEAMAFQIACLRSQPVSPEQVHLPTQI
ncbi:MAG TPA: glycosyltransferase family 4 protein [Acidisarcina sp.]